MSSTGWRTRGPVVWTGRALLLALLAFAAMVLALAVAPRVPVSVFGQTVEVGAVPPTSGLSLSGPGQADLFGEGTVETVQHFDGPIRPKIVWQKFNRNDDAAAFLQSDSGGTAAVGDALVAGWTRYFVLLVVVAGILGGVLYLVSVGMRALSGRDTRHRTRRRHLALLAAGVAASMVVTLGFTALTVRTAVASLGSIGSLADLVGTATVAQIPDRVGPTRTDVDVVVIGDSTAAGIGNAPVTDPTKEDEACQRSSDAYASSLRTISGRTVLNLACSSATVSAGLLGPQLTGGIRIAPQVGVLRAIESADTVVVSIGANDVGWSDFLTLCYGLPRCDDEASDRLFQSRLDAFKITYAQLLQQLSDLPGQPDVVITEYYDPFGDTVDCDQLRAPDDVALPAGAGFADKQSEKIDPLRSELSRMNAVLVQGAAAFDFTVARPSFEGHALCDDQSWVQGMSDPAPFHPRAAGELAIAATILAQLPT